MDAYPDEARIIGAVMGEVASRTGVATFYDPDGKAAPFYSVEYLGGERADTKTQFRELIRLRFHCVARPRDPYSPACAFGMAPRLKSALAEPFALPEGCGTLEDVRYAGVKAVNRDPSGEPHGVVDFDLVVGFGLRCK